VQGKTIHLHDDLVKLCQSGDTRSHRKLYNLYSKAMYNICYRMVNDADDAADILQEAFVSAFRNLESYHGDATFGAWLKRIVINKAINFLKKRRLDLEPLNEGNHVWEKTEEPYDTNNYNIHSIKKAIQQLPEGYRLVFSLYLLEGYDHSEIAGILGITESTSKSQYNRAKKKLRELLNTEYNDDGRQRRST